MLSRAFPSRILVAFVIGTGFIFLSFSSYRSEYSLRRTPLPSAIDSLKAPILHAAPPATTFESILTAPTNPSRLVPQKASDDSWYTRPSFSPKPSSSGQTNHPKPNSRCNAYKKSDDIQVVLKTGANEVFDKLPTQLLTMLQCVSDLLIFSDLEQQLGAYHIHDALDNITEAVKTGNGDFDYYRTLQEYKKLGMDIGKLKESTGDAAWNLDKYKFIPMLEKSWQMKPHKRWYVFIEADTYLVWSNLLLWLEKMDPDELIYLGSPTYIADEEFGHGGSGVILSGAAMAKMFEKGTGKAGRFDVMAKDEQLGDLILMKALRENGVKFRSAWPTLQAEKPSTIPFGPGPDNGVRHWCQPIVTMHHITAGEASAIWQFELERSDPMKPLLLSELYQSMTRPHIAPERDDWHNLSDDIEFKPPGVDGGRLKPIEEQTDLEKKAHKSFEDCRAACHESGRCWQFVFHDRTCGFSYSYRSGAKRKPDNGKSFKSGWDLEKIEKDQKGNRCDEPQWLAVD